MLIEQLLDNPSGGAREREESDRVGKFSVRGAETVQRGSFSTVSATSGIGQVPEYTSEMRAAANFLVANYGRQEIIAMPRSVPKIAIFQEAARTLEMPGEYG